MIFLENISYNHGFGEDSLKDLNLKLNKGDLICVLGANGSGKTTLINILAGLKFPYKGNYYFENKKILEKFLSDAKNNALFRSKVGVLFQNPDLQLFSPTVLDDVLFGPMQMGLKKEEAMERAYSCAELLGLKNILDRPGYSLSGGEKKKAALAAVLACAPEVYLLDEPTDHLDAKSKEIVSNIIFTLSASRKTIVVSTNDLKFAKELKGQCLVLSQDRTTAYYGRSSQVFSDEKILSFAGIL